MIIWILLFVAFLAFMKHYWSTMFYWSSINVKQSRLPVPVFGDAVKAVFKMECQFDLAQRAYNHITNVRYSGFYHPAMRMLVLREPDLIKQITVKDFDHFVDHLNFARDIEPLWSKNLFALQGEPWKEMRATLSPTFTSSKMRLMFELMEKSAKQYVEFYLKQDQNVIELELKDSFTRFANDVIANCAFGVTVDSLKDRSNEFYLNGKEVTDFNGFWRGMRFLFALTFPKLGKMFGISLFAKETMTFFKTLVRDTVQLREDRKIVRPDMINLLIEARKGQLKFEETAEQNDSGFATVEESEIGKNEGIRQIAMTEDDMAAQVLIFFFAGFDTISTVMSFACYELALHPDIQDRLRNEIDETNKATNGKLTYDALNKMKYLDMVITETLRKDPPFAVVDRVCTKAYTIPAELPGETAVHLTPGDIIWIPISGIQHDEQYYPSPEKFDPERFSDENKGNINPYAFLPFGAGPRNCIGSRFALMEAKTLIYHVLSNFELVVIKKTRIPIKLANDGFSPMIEGGFWIGFKRRNANVN